MNIKKYPQVCADLEKGRKNRELLLTAFRQFLTRVEAMADPRCNAHGIAVSVNGDEALVDYLDRRIRIWMDFDRMSEKGIVVADDVTDSGYTKSPARIAEIPFDYSGETEIPGGYMPQKNFSLHQDVDGLDIALSIVDLAINRKRSAP